MAKSPIQNDSTPEKVKKKTVVKKKQQVQPFEGYIDRIVSLVVEKLQPEINKMHTNLKNENRAEVQQLRFDIEKLRPPVKQTSGINSPKEIVAQKIKGQNLLDDPEMKKILSQLTGLSSATPAASVPQVSNTSQLVSQTPQMNGLTLIVELFKALSPSGGSFGGGGGNVMSEMMIRSWLAQQNRQTVLYDQLTKQLVMKLGGTEQDLQDLQKTGDALMNPLKKHGASVEGTQAT